MLFWRSIYPLEMERYVAQLRHDQDRQSDENVFFDINLFFDITLSHTLLIETVLTHIKKCRPCY